MKDYYSPRPTAVGGSLNPQAGGSGSVGGISAAQTPKVELPEIGAKILLVIQNFGGVYIVGDGNNLAGGLDVVEVEVVAIKKSKTSIE